MEKWLLQKWKSGNIGETVAVKLKPTENLVVIFVALLFSALFASQLQAGEFYRQGKQAFSKGELEKAFMFFKKAAAKRPSDGNPLFYMGYIREQQGDIHNSIDYYRRALKLKIDKDLREKSYWKVVLYYREQEDWGNLLLYSTAFLKFHNYKTVRKLQELARKNHNQNSHAVLLLMQEAEQQKKKGELKEAVASLKKALALIPGYQPAYWRLALIYMKQGDFAAAASNLQLLIESSPERWEYHYKMAVCNYQLGRYDLAEKELAAAEKFHKGDSSSDFKHYAFFLQGRIDLEKGKFTAALWQFKKAKRFHKSTLMQASLGRAYYQLGRQKEAKEAADRAVSGHPPQADGFWILYEIEKKNERTENAFARAHSLFKLLQKNNHTGHIERRPVRFAPAFAFLGKMAAAEKRWELTVAALKSADALQEKAAMLQKEQAIKNEPVEKYDAELAEAWMRTGEPKLALQRFQNVPSSPHISYYRARCYALLLEVEAAKQHLLLAAESNPQFWEQSITDEAFSKLIQENRQFKQFLQSRGKDSSPQNQPLGQNQPLDQNQSWGVP